MNLRFCFDIPWKVPPRPQTSCLEGKQPYSKPWHDRLNLVEARLSSMLLFICYNTKPYFGGAGDPDLSRLDYYRLGGDEGIILDTEEKRQYAKRPGYGHHYLCRMPQVF